MARQIGIDLGSANTLFYLKDKGIILSSPTVIAIDENTGRDIAIGSQAKKMLGKTPPNIKVSRPVRDGVISEMDDTTLFIARLLEKTELISFFSRPDAFVCVPTKCTEVECRAVQTAVYEAGTRNVKLVKEPLAAAVGAGLKVLSHKGSMIVDIGEGTTETAVISRGEIVTTRSQKMAGSSLDRAIMNYFYNERRVEIGELTAEKLKIKLGVANSFMSRGEMEVVGRSLRTGMVTATVVNSRDLSYAMESVINSIVHQIQLTLTDISPELSSDISNKGIILSGGGALLPGLPEYISSKLGMKVGLAPKPLESVCTGIGRMLESDGELNKILIKEY